MTLNHILKTIIKSLGLDEEKALAIYQLADPQITQKDVTDALKKEGAADYVELNDAGLELFLDGLITYKRGASGNKRKEKKEPVLSNNTILKKLRIALEFKDEDMLKIFALAGIELSKSELTPYFRKEGHRNYKECKDRMLIDFIKALEEYFKLA